MTFLLLRFILAGMKKILYYDCFAGISGDMNLAALLDLGVPLDYLKKELAKLSLPGWKLSLERVSKQGIEANYLKVLINGQHDHQHEHDHQHRKWKEIRQLIEKSNLNETVIKHSLGIFSRIAEAEAKVHGKDVEEIAFHEVGALDSIIDIVGAAICLDYLKPEQIVARPPQLGGGFVKCAHGTMPVPAPATLEILKGLPIAQGGEDFEMTTPTGAAILAECASEFNTQMKYKPLKIGWGAGSRNTKRLPNLLRCILTETEIEIAQPSTQEVILIESNIDDMNPEWFSPLINELFAKGALDVWLENLMMKKSRPGIKISLLAQADKKDILAQSILRLSSSFGLRYTSYQRQVLDRSFVTVNTPWGKARVKEGRLANQLLKAVPEYEDCLLLAQKNNLPLQQIYQKVQMLYENQRKA